MGFINQLITGGPHIVAMINMVGPDPIPFNVGFHPAINHPATDLATNVTNDIPFLGVYQQTNQLTN